MRVFIHHIPSRGLGKDDAKFIDMKTSPHTRTNPEIVEFIDFHMMLAQLEAEFIASGKDSVRVWYQSSVVSD
jgi:hypothetical protein